MTLYKILCPRGYIDHLAQLLEWGGRYTMRPFSWFVLMMGFAIVLAERKSPERPKQRGKMAILQPKHQTGVYFIQYISDLAGVYFLETFSFETICITQVPVILDRRKKK